MTKGREENTMNIIKGNTINLRFATENDRKVIYNMLISQETSHFMFNEDNPAPTWSEFCEEDESYYLGKSSENGSYLLIEYVEKVIGSISYACEYEKTPYCEIDIWMGKLSDTGRGLGTEAIRLVLDLVHKEFKINDFLIRPWRKNTNAIKAYEKCGFVKVDSIKLEKYYSDQAMIEYGDGDYGKEETVTLIKVITNEV